ncbi:MAG: hypothetical protein U0798_15265 [Gemmataceae bacterium]
MLIAFSMRICFDVIILIPGPEYVNGINPNNSVLFRFVHFPVFHNRISSYISGMKPTKPSTANRGRGRPKQADKVRLSVDISPECRKKVDDFTAEKQWLLNVAVENIIEGYFAMLAERKQS